MNRRIASIFAVFALLPLLIARCSRHNGCRLQPAIPQLLRTWEACVCTSSSSSSMLLRI